MKHLFKFLLLSVSFCLSANSSFGQSTTSESIYFDFDNAELSETEQLKLDAFIKSNTNKERKVINVNINGHTDSYGSDTYNYQLSTKRATAVYYRVLQLGIPESLISYQGFGEQQLIITKGNQIIQKENRRVTVTLTLEAIKENKTLEAQTATTLTLSDLYQNAKKPYDTYTIRAGEVAFIDAKNTRLQFMSDAFSHLPKGTPITIRLTEYYNYSDMILANLTTETNGKMLSTNGMIHVDAFVDGQLTNMTGQAYVWFPKSELDDMQPYFGEEGEEGVTWALLAGNINEIPNLKNYESYAERPRLYPNPTSYYRYFTPWQKFWHIFLYGKEDYLMYANAQTSAEILSSYGYNPDSIEVQKVFENFSNGDKITQAKIQAILNNEILSVNQLGWINCDRFNNIPKEEKRALTVDIKPDTNLAIKVICKDQKGIMPAYREKQNYIVNGLPKELNVIVVAIRTSNDKPELAIKSLTSIKNIEENDLKFMTYNDYNDLRKALKVLD